MRIEKKTILYAAGVLACGNILLQALGFVYRVMLSYFAGAEGLGVYRLVHSAYLVLHAGCLSGVTMACSRLSAAAQACGRQDRVAMVRRLAFTAFFSIFAFCAAIVLLFRQQIAQNLLGDARCAAAFPFLLLCLALTGIENILKSIFIGLDQVQYTASSEVGEQLIRMVAVGTLLYLYNGQDYGKIAMLIFGGMVISEVFSACFLTRLFRKNLRILSVEQRDPVLTRQFFSIAAPLSVAALAGNLIGSAGSVLLPRRLVVAGLTYDQALGALGVLSGMAMPLMLLPVALVSSVCTALLPAITAAQAMGQIKRVRALVGRAVTTVGLIAVPATAVLVPLAPRLSALIFRQPLTGTYAAFLGVLAITAYYQMASGSLLNALGRQHWHVATSIAGEVLQIVLLYRWCADPAWGIYGYFAAMIVAGSGVFLCNLWMLRRESGFALRPLRRFGVPFLSGGILFLWTRWMLWFLLPRCSSEAGALIGAAMGAMVMYVLVLRLLGVHFVRYLAQRIDWKDKPQMPFALL